MIKNFIAALFLLLFTFSFAQESTSSPYSFYGIGEVRFSGTIENRSMAGISMIPDSIHINLQNPAMYSDLKLTNFSVGGTFSVNELKTFAQKEKAQRTAVDYIAVGLPFKRFGLGFGLIPYSSVGFQLRKQSVANEIVTNTGSGGINKAFIGVGFKINKKLNFGAEFQYNFGTIRTINVTEVSGLQYGTFEENVSYINGVNFNLGLAYKTKINAKTMAFSSLTYAPGASLTNESDRTVSLIQSPQSMAPIVLEFDDKINLPTRISFGLGVGQLTKWSVGAELTFKENSRFTNRFADISNVSYKNATKIAVGGFYIPKYNSYTNYFSRIVYKAGLRYENMGLVLNGKTIADAAFTLGMSLPLKNTFSSLNISYERGSRGTTANNLIRENYHLISLGLSFNDRWFVKRKYN